MRFKQPITKPMTDWNKLGARERDALVAEKVMGWEWLERSNHEQGQYVWRKAIFPPEGEEWIRWNFNPHEWRKASAETPLFSDWDRCSGQRDDDRKLGSRRIMGLPPLTTEIQSAWLVVERMRAKGWRIWLDDRGEEWRAVFHPKSGPMATMPTYAPTAPEAICLAALRAVGVGV